MPQVQRVPVPEQARSLADLEQVDYADAFAVAVAARRTPEEWMRLARTSMPELFALVRVAHRTLGLQLAPAHAPGALIGWNIVRSDREAAVLGNTGLLGTARIIGLTTPGRLTLATLIRLNGATGRAMWAAAAPLHRTVARRVLGRLPVADPPRGRALPVEDAAV